MNKKFNNRTYISPNTGEKTPDFKTMTETLRKFQSMTELTQRSKLILNHQCTFGSKDNADLFKISRASLPQLPSMVETYYVAREVLNANGNRTSSCVSKYNVTLDLNFATLREFLKSCYTACSSNKHFQRNLFHLKRNYNISLTTEDYFMSLYISEVLKTIKEFYRHYTNTSGREYVNIENLSALEHDHGIFPLTRDLVQIVASHRQFYQCDLGMKSIFFINLTFQVDQIMTDLQLTKPFVDYVNGENMFTNTVTEQIIGFKTSCVENIARDGKIMTLEYQPVSLLTADLPYGMTSCFYAATDTQYRIYQLPGLFTDLYSVSFAALLKLSYDYVISEDFHELDSLNKIYPRMEDKLTDQVEKTPFVDKPNLTDFYYPLPPLTSEQVNAFGGNILFGGPGSSSTSSGTSDKGNPGDYENPFEQTGGSEESNVMTSKGGKDLKSKPLSGISTTTLSITGSDDGSISETKIRVNKPIKVVRKMINDLVKTGKKIVEIKEVCDKLGVKVPNKSVPDEKFDISKMKLDVTGGVASLGPILLGKFIGSLNPKGSQSTG